MRVPARIVALVVVAAVAAAIATAVSFAFVRLHFNLRVAADAPPRSGRAVAGRLLTIHFYSAALRKRADYLVYVPREYVPWHPLPAFYMLHGMPGRPLAFTVNGHVEIRIEKLIRERRMQPMILVFPDGRIDGNAQTDSEWANTKSGRFDSYVVDVVHDVDSRFATLPYRQDRVVAGLSAGAYGAINVVLHHLDVFGEVQVWSGYFIQSRAGVFAHATSSQLDNNSPLRFVDSLTSELARYPLRAFLLVGRGDSDRGQVAPMTAALRAHGADAHYAIYSGGHSWQLWNEHLNQMLILAGRDVSRPLKRIGPPVGGARALTRVAPAASRI